MRSRASSGDVLCVRAGQLDVAGNGDLEVGDVGIAGGVNDQRFGCGVAVLLISTTRSFDAGEGDCAIGCTGSTAAVDGQLEGVHTGSAVDLVEGVVLVLAEQGYVGQVDQANGVILAVPGMMS